MILEQSKRAHVGHIGSSLSIVDLLAVLYSQTDILRIPAPGDPARDRFILSKGHAALALFCALHLRGWLPAETLDTYCADDSLLGVHPEHGVPGVDFATGSLGMGLGFAAGCALAARIENTDRRAFVLVSDAECNEGAMYEAALFAAQHRLANLVLLVDDNKQQAFGYTKDVLQPTPLAEVWHALSWDTHVVDGHDHDALAETLRGLDYTTGKPHVLLAQTVFGKGVSYMEGVIKWHYWPMTDEEYAQALSEVGDGA